MSELEAETGVVADEDQRKIAYALNLCMVSVSQIIDYDDIYILEQEYDAILNNLNLEEMPKDEALLDVLKQLLNVITFFRIQEGDKAFLEREYQQRMKDAIWSAVPNLGVIVAGGSWKAMAASLVTQVGIGYMNYRREKARVQLERDRDYWKLQRAAMEQFNGLRRELFAAAWRLADTHNFPDAYRITERQITRYNKILMDPDPLRRYERLCSIADRFEAYPPFLYFQGNAANMVYQNEKYDLEVRSQYRSLACQHFKDFLERTEHNLLREDHLLASGSLEYFDILIGIGNTPIPELEELLAKAIDVSGHTLDVVQLCATSYLRLGNFEKAAKLLRTLVNEEYNTDVNAQLLSLLYVTQMVQQGDEDARVNYLTLKTRINSDILYPLPKMLKEGGHCFSAQELQTEQANTLQIQFLNVQKGLLERKYDSVMNSLLQQYTIRFNRIIPVADTGKEYPDSYFEGAGEARKQDILNLFSDPRNRQEYVYRLASAHIESRIIAWLNDLYSAVCSLPCMEEVSARKQFYDLILKQTQDRQGKLDKLLSKLYSTEPQSIDREDCKWLLSRTPFSFIEKGLEALKVTISTSVQNLTSMVELARTETALYQFCDKYGLPAPTLTFLDAEDSVAQTSFSKSITSAPLRFDERLIGPQAQRLKEEQELAQSMTSYVQAHQKALLPGKKNPAKLYIQGNDRLVSFIEKERALREFNQGQIIAVIHTKEERILVLTTVGVCRYLYDPFFWMEKRLDIPVPYASVESMLKKKEFKVNEKQIDIKEFQLLIHDLANVKSKDGKAAHRLGTKKEV